MHLRSVSTSKNILPARAGLRENLEVLLLFLDVVGAVMGIVRKEPWDSGHHHDHDHDHHHGHTH